MTTIRELVRYKPTETQYELFQRADRRFDAGVGRYYGGPLTDGDVRVLTDDLEAFGTKHQRGTCRCCGATADGRVVYTLCAACATVGFTIGARGEVLCPECGEDFMGCGCSAPDTADM